MIQDLGCRVVKSQRPSSVGVGYASGLKLEGL